MEKKTRVAAMADIHIKTSNRGQWKTCFEEITTRADLLLIGGDLTNTGDEDEAHVLADEIRHVGIPVLAVLGNHDFEKGRQKIIRQILQDANIKILDGEAEVIGNVGVAGVKGFGGGFDKYMLSMFGEDSMKAFVQETVNESLLLDRALARLEQEHPEVVKIALMHYAPVSGTIAGEPLEIYPFLGSSHLAEPLQRRNVKVAFHGHAHAGRYESVTASGIPVYNVAVNVLQTHFNDTTYYTVIEIAGSE
ncbi:metallophosphoesterase [Sphingobacterium shayense]|uniref:metallophosphoesterase family protein n=1 Tax=Sphingobacterium shayense TaxID=626343 RepID=UPI0015550ACF|nr:metallophosphoesterase [Sphingobacterium shayense]NQD72067.1 metallophosphoesterase [Sphingobacterium shayense]